jgi:hypothetical protein
MLPWKVEYVTLMYRSFLSVSFWLLCSNWSFPWSNTQVKFEFVGGFFWGFFYSSDGSRFMPLNYMSEKFQIYVKRLNILHNGFDHLKQVKLYFAFYSLYSFQSYIHLNLF